MERMPKSEGDGRFDESILRHRLLDGPGQQLFDLLVRLRPATSCWRLLRVPECWDLSASASSVKPYQPQRKTANQQNERHLPVFSEEARSVVRVLE